ncbi:uncharacterized protein LOC113238083 [Hyposmocoma kahamanoa]|uniref:uncharacterized protein LOC113238083 n=1 Tax=Hyposmocoma kahamanoa TaxID=1477025 RepID=UPI000E6D71D9|nr:uncharacterized protein LOC113238083 [Hyposmocoma kahamanoa]
MTAEHNKKWKCLECVSKEPKSDNTNTPVKCDLQQCTGGKQDGKFSANVIMRNRIVTTSISPAEPLAKVTAESELVNELRLFKEEMRTEIREFKLIVSYLTAAINCCNRRMDDLAARVEVVERNQLDGPTTATSSLENAISELKLELNDRNQELLRNDIEIAGVPEENHERSIHLALTVACKLGLNLEERDIVSAERAGPIRHMEEVRTRPRPIVVRLARRLHRDQLLAAARVRRGTTTMGLGVDSDKHRVHINERLTRTNRQLFYKARGEALRAHWKYVWTRDGKIFARKEHGSSRYRLRSDKDLCTVFGQ